MELYAHGGISGISRALNDESACRAVNKFLRSKFSGQDFHRDSLQSQDGPSSRPSDFKRTFQSRDHSGFIYWRSNKNGDAPAKVQMKSKIQVGSWHDSMTNQSLSTLVAFIKSSREDHMWALAAYTLQAFKWLTNKNAKRLSSLGSLCQIKKMKPKATIHAKSGTQLAYNGLAHFGTHSHLLARIRRNEIPQQADHVRRFQVELHQEQM